LMVELASGTQYQTDSMVRMALGTDVLGYLMPTLPPAGIVSLSGSNRVQSLVILAVFSRYTDTI
jgi:hypothetical protein